MREVNWQSGRPEDLFARAGWVVDRKRRGWTYRELAAQASLDNARSFRPQGNDDELEILARTKGVSVSESNMSHYDKAWLDVEAAGIVPDPETLWLSYQLAFRGSGSRERRKALARAAREAGSDAARQYFLDFGRRLLDEYPP